MALNTAGDYVAVIVVLVVILGVMVCGFLQLTDAAYWRRWRLRLRNCRLGAARFAATIQRNMEQ